MRMGFMLVRRGRLNLAAKAIKCGWICVGRRERDNVLDEKKSGHIMEWVERIWLFCLLNEFMELSTKFIKSLNRESEYGCKVILKVIFNR